MKNKVRIFSAEEKTKIVLELLKEDITLAHPSAKTQENITLGTNFQKLYDFRVNYYDFEG